MRTNRPENRAGRMRMGLLVVIASMVVLVGFVLPAVKQVYKAADRSPYLDNLKQQAATVANCVSTFAKGKGLPWSKPSSPYLQHPGLSDGYGQSPTGTALPWQSDNSPYLQH